MSTAWAASPSELLMKAAEKAAGKVQNAVGGAKDAIRDAAKK